MTAPGFDDLAGSTALVTGSSRGIGAGLADALEAAGVKVLRHGSAPTPGSPELIVADLASAEGVAALTDAVHERVDHLDLVVNNAGVELPSRLENMSDDSLRRTLDVNLTAPLLVTRSLLPLLRAGRGRSVVMVTSIHDAVPYSGNVAYVASKAGLEAATRTLALELASDRIRVNALAPGAIETELNREVIDEMGRDRFDSWIPLGRVGQIDDLVGALLFLASEASRYVSGARLLVDGGYSQALLRYGLDD